MRVVPGIHACSLLSAVLAISACGDDGKTSVAIGGSVSGLAGSGLVLHSSRGEDLAISGDGAFSFPTPVAYGTAYAVTVASQPASPTQTCLIANGTGTVHANLPVTDIVVTCQTGAFTVGGTVTGLSGTGLVLDNNGAGDLAISADGTFAFATPAASGTAFAVRVKTQPSGPTQTCTVSGGAGTMGAGPVTTVVVDCTVDRFTVGGVISGLAGTVVLHDSTGGDITVSSTGSFAFPTTVASGASYAVTVGTQPSSPSQTCVVTSGSGTVSDADITSVRVDCTTDRFAVGGTVTGLAGTGLVLQERTGATLAVSSDGAFSFATPVDSGSDYAVTVLSQPSGPTQDCQVTGGAGTMAGSDITSVVVTCTTRRFTIGGTVTGLVGTGLVLQDNHGDDLAIGADGAFTFATPVASGQSYAVTALAQPAGPSQTCTVSGDTGVVGAASVTSVVVNCTTNMYTVGGTITGLAGTVVLRNNAGDDQTVTSDGSFAFAIPVASGGAYDVSVLTQPGTPSQTCVVAGGAGTVGGANVTSVAVTCTTNAFAIRGTVTGLLGTGLVLQDNAGDDLAIAADGSFRFATAVASGQVFQVTALAQPTGPSQTCVIAGGTGTVAASDVTSVTVTCATNQYLIGGTVAGLVGTGLVLQNTAGDDLAIDANGTFHFATPVASGHAYAVTTLTQPLGPSQTCVVTAGSGTVNDADVASVAVTCTTNRYAIGGTVTGLVGGGLVLQNTGGDDLAISGDGSFSFATPVASGQAYAVTVHADPASPSQTCAVTGGTGSVGGADVTTISVNCTTNAYAVGGTISGLSGTVVLQNSGGDDLSVSGNGSFAFATPIASGQAYAVTVATNPGSPIAQTCQVTDGAGTIGGAAITSVVVTCTTNRYAIGGTVSGLASGGSLVVRDNNADDLTITANGSFQFVTAVASGLPYAVTVATNPASPVAQTCQVARATGIVGSANVTDVAITCTTNRYTIGGTVTGLTGAGLVLRDNGGDDLAIGASGSFAFATPVASGASYAVTVAAQPAGQSCVVANGAGTVGGANITSVTVSCSASPVCKIVNGVRWCKDTVSARSCNAFCTAIGFGNPTISDAAWFAAQNTSASCSAIAGALGLTVQSINSYTYACAEALPTGLLCSNYSGCPANHRTASDGGTHLAICPCE